jgi:hypothetical protein
VLAAQPVSPRQLDLHGCSLPRRGRLPNSWPPLRRLNHCFFEPTPATDRLRSAGLRYRLQVAGDDVFADLSVDLTGLDADEVIVALPSGAYD